MTRMLVLLHSICLLGLSAVGVAAKKDTLTSPAEGVLCGRYFCADRNGISDRLTAQYIGDDAAYRLLAQADFDRTSFTFANGLFCNLKEQRCYEVHDRDTRNGTRRPISLYYTSVLFGDRVLLSLPK
ncbi:YcgJ family protein [Brucella pituitosa]|uniref:YcgJ family protein n=1 Tax=Brucella pituitosa TaxID=571256 RepID=UPI0009A19DFE|nr:YcgJ family protein [Brucella pituitosa]